MQWITPGDINAWLRKSKKDCETTFPELISRLILSTPDVSIEEIDFPSGDNTVVGGWDGHLKSSTGAAFFPKGESVWEIGTENSTVVKANEDFDKRTKNPRGLNKKRTTYVCVTPRVFRDRDKWQINKKKLGKWQDVNVVAVDKLVLWLLSSPSVALWLARRIGKVSPGMQDIEGAWETWATGTVLEKAPSLVIAGRGKEVEEICKWEASGNPSILEVQGDSPDEPKAFLYAALASREEQDRLRAFSRCLVVEGPEEFKECCNNATFKNLVIVAPSGCRDVAALAVTRGHQVFLTADAAATKKGVTRLSRPKRRVIEELLTKNGFSALEAQNLSRDFGRSIPVLRRNLYPIGTSQPTWAVSENADILLPALFASSWDESKEGDKKVIEVLSGKDYASYVKGLGKFRMVDDSPIKKVGNVWTIQAPLDAWALLAPHISEDFLETFRNTLTSIVTKTDPKYKLAPDKRWAAAVYGKENTYSELIQKGMMGSLVLLAVHDECCPQIPSAKSFVNRVARDILSKATTWKIWASLKEITPLLAEAAPEVFLKTLEEIIEKNPEILKQLMTDEDSFLGECKHCGLLWALEALAWDEEYFPGAVSILLKLAQIDPGGKYNNRPLNSLKDIFRPGHPQTGATPATRITLLEQLSSLDQKLTWEFVKGYFGPQSFSESHRFRWRGAGSQRRGLEAETGEDGQEYLQTFFPKALELACQKENLPALLDDFIRIPDPLQERLLQELLSQKLPSFTKKEILEVFEHSRSALHWINTFGKGEVKNYVERLEKVMKKFEPKDIFERLGWLVNNPWPDLPEGDPRNDYDAKTKAIVKAREKAAREILDAVSLKEIVEYANGIEYQGVLADSLGKVVKDGKEDNAVLDAMLPFASKSPLLIQSYAKGRVSSKGQKWIEAQTKRLKRKGTLTPENEALLYFGLPSERHTWDLLEARGKEVSASYWKFDWGYFEGDDPEDAVYVVQNLLEADRPYTALARAGESKVNLPSALLHSIIESILKHDPKKHKDSHPGGLDGYHLGNIFRQLREQNELSLEEMVKLEWPFVSILRDLSRRGHSAAVHKLLQKDPHFFVELVSYACKEDDKRSVPIEREGNSKVMAENAYEALHSWRLVPGMQEDGTFDEGEFLSWIEAARKECAEKKLVIGGDVHIGFMLSRAPKDSDGVWPHKVVRDLIESLRNDVIERHIETGLFNSRGVVQRELDAGGKSERALAEQYNEQYTALRVSWPRTAKILKGLADSYHEYAKDEDNEADVRSLLYD